MRPLWAVACAGIAATLAAAAAPEAPDAHMSAAAAGAAALPPAVDDLLPAVWRMFTARDAAALVRAARAAYRGDAAFGDPPMLAAGRAELELQFYSLQKLFARVEVAPTGPPVVLPSAKEGRLVVEVPNNQAYYFASGAALRLRAVTRLEVDVAARRPKVVLHDEFWVGALGRVRLPAAVRRANAAASNAVFRWRGWEDELRAAGGGGGGEEKTD